MWLWGLRSRGCRWRRGLRSRCGSRLLLLGRLFRLNFASLKDAAGLLPSREITQSQGGDHKNNGHAGGQSSEKISCPTAAENRRAGAAEDRPHVRPLARLQEHDQYQPDADNNVDYGNKRNHHLLFRAKQRMILKKSSALRLAPPTNRPLTSVTLANSPALSGRTLPP